MNRWDTFTFRVNQDERRLIAFLAEKLQRSQSDAVRFVVINAARKLTDQCDPIQPLTKVQRAHDEVPEE